MTRLHDLDAYLTGELADAAAEAFEEALFDAPDDSDVGVLDRIARYGRRIADNGMFEMAITRADLDERIARGASIHVAEAGAPNGLDVAPREVTVSRTADFACTKLTLGLRDIERVDAEIVMLDHANLTKTIRDLRVDPVDGNVYLLCERPLAMLAFGAGRTNVRLRRSGRHDVVAEYSLVGALAP